MASTMEMMGVFAFDFIAFGLALAAEQTRSTAKVVPDADFNYTYCVYDSNVATILGIIASIFLLLSQAVMTKSFRKIEWHGGSRNCAIGLFIICWVTLFIAEGCLWWGSISNAQETKYRSIYVSEMPHYCHTLRKGVFEAGAVLTIIYSFLSKINYICHSKTEESLELENISEMGTYTPF